ncbi:MAG: allantoinase AllB [Bacteroidota bacterium]
MKAFFSNQVLLPEGLQSTTILVKGGKLERILPGKVDTGNLEFLDFGNAVIMPGLIDPHVHINEPGRTEWEGFETGTMAAAAGGVTTIVDMPLNSSPVTTNVAALQEKLDAAKGKLHVNCGFWGGLTPQSLGDLEGLLETEVLGVKVFLTHSGIDDFPDIGQSDLSRVMPLIKTSGKPILAHCEISRPHADQALLENNPTSYQNYLASRPPSWEIEAIEMMIDLCRTSGCRTHIVHLATAEAISSISKAKDEGLPLTVETCPQYLCFSAEEIPDGQTVYKCAPPIREAANQKQLWEAIKTGLIDFLATDHSPAPPKLKEIDSGNLAKAWGGIAGLQFFLPAIWTKAKTQNLTLPKLSKLWSSNAAAFLGIGHRKGKIAKGYDADLVIWHPDEQFTVTESMIFHKHKPTPYLGQQLYGKVMLTMVNGQLVYQNGQIVGRNYGSIVV